MATFFGALVLLVLGYVFYSKFVERVFIINDSTPTPAYTKRDNLDYVPMSWWKGNLIQLLNIAGLGPIYGAVAGALYGPAAFIWIVAGTIFAGGVHDYFSGMMSLRHQGEQYPSLVGRYLGQTVKTIISVVSLVLMVLVAAAFTAGPAQLIAQLTPLSFTVSLLIIFAYFLLATILPINRVIGKIYPLLGGILLFMALAIGISLLFSGKSIPNLTLENLHPGELPIWPLLMVTISCGAISGFHCTQSPIVACTMKKESDGRKIFYGAMVTEGVIALIWAAAGMTFFNGTAGLGEALAAGGPSGVVNEISTSLLGTLGGILAILGVIILPITTGDTALRSSRMILTEIFAKFFNMESKIKILLVTVLVAVPALFLATIDYTFLWRYVGWTNQVVATVMLWTGTVYLLKNSRFHWICGVPALFMTGVVCTYIFYAPEGLGMDYRLSMIIGFSLAAAVLAWYISQIFKYRQLRVNSKDFRAA
ncbi:MULTISPECIES: carbon starvation protein A [Bacillaceae]|uniref:CstA-like carbon starvation protein n=2 Tax=Bacillus infantis TaxID=324767 RepID=U5L750_9BACI|nr:MULTISPECIES: carbon starvation CstA family protein [Bacillus]OXT17577.1 carbon starvation protein A [Bacillus sp. OG2]AGX02482.1 CstA-like carbon starvation protein [Bacillus infantis NRRL B-14911]MCA1037339.1 carbon starvation protein A [Bacillus infantis]MCP1156737.1 carbon starvation protein A [Bacillus infantis]MDT0160953.1 carbon starvation CstA family protein [Bacillus sp. AG4(2022)]